MTVSPANVAAQQSSLWKDIQGNADLSGSFDALSRAWDTNDSGAVFGTTLITVYTALLDAKVPGLGSGIRDRIVDWMHPSKDPFAESELRILEAIAQSEANVLSALEELWARVHADHSNMVYATYGAAVADLEEVMAKPRWQRVDTATRSKLDRVVTNLNTVRLWLEQQSDPTDVIGNLHQYMLVLETLIEAKSEATTLDYFGDRYYMEGEGLTFDAWIETVQGTDAGSTAASLVQDELGRLLSTGTFAAFDYLIGQQSGIRSALRNLRNERFREDGNTPGYAEFWYQLDEFEDDPCWTQQVSLPEGCFSVNAQACGSFSAYAHCAQEASQILELHKWFAYGEMLMEIWAPVRIALDDLWRMSGASGYRPVGPLDRDMDDFMSATTDLSAVLTQGYLQADPLPHALYILSLISQGLHERERNFITGRGLRFGEEFIYDAVDAFFLDDLRWGYPTGKEWARVLGEASTTEEVEAHFIATKTAKIMAIL